MNQMKLGARVHPCFSLGAINAVRTKRTSCNAQQAKDGGNHGDGGARNSHKLFHAASSAGSSHSLNATKALPSFSGMCSLSGIEYVTTQ